MKTLRKFYIVKKIFKKLKVSNLLIFLLIIILVLLSGCKQEMVEIDLENTKEGIIQFSQEEKDVVYFGFDLRLGPKEDATIYIPFLQYLSKETGYNFEIHFTSEYDNTQNNLGDGITQFAAIGALSYIRAHDLYEVACLVRGLNLEYKDKYRSAIVTLPDSDINKIEDIKGKIFGFGSIYSTQGHLLPRKMLEDANIKLVDLEKYVYTGCHRNCIAALVNNDCDVAGVQDTLAISLANQGKIKIIAFSDYYPSSGISVNKDVECSLSDIVKQALLSFEPKGKHSGLLKDWDSTEMPCGFVEAEDEDYDELRELAIKYDIIK